MATKTKKMFLVVYEISGTAHCEVEAENEEDAKKIADKEGAATIHEWECVRITDVEEV